MEVLVSGKQNQRTGIEKDIIVTIYCFVLFKCFTICGATIQKTFLKEEKVVEIKLTT